MPFNTANSLEEAQSILTDNGYVKDEETSILWELPPELAGWDYAYIIVTHSGKFVIKYISETEATFPK